MVEHEDPGTALVSEGAGAVQPPTAFGYLGGVRMIMPAAEYELNQNFNETARAAGCDPLERPII